MEDETMNNLNELYKQLKELRIHQHQSQTSVSEYMGFRLSSSLSHVEAGKRNISIAKLLRWLNALGINLNDIIDSSKRGIDFNLLHKVLHKVPASKINHFLKNIDKKG